MNEPQDIVQILVETARSIKRQAEIVRKQSSDLMKEAERIRAAGKKAQVIRPKKSRK